MADKQNQINLFDLIFNGTAEYLARAEKLVAETIATHSPDTVIKLPETAYALPVIYAVTGEKIETVGDLNHAMELAKDRIGRTRLLQSAINAGVASGMLCEIIQACKYVDGKPHPEWVDGHLSDAIVRSFGVDLVNSDDFGLPPRRIKAASTASSLAAAQLRNPTAQTPSISLDGDAHATDVA